MNMPQIIYGGNVYAVLIVFTCGNPNQNTGWYRRYQPEEHGYTANGEQWRAQTCVF